MQTSVMTLPQAPPSALPLALRSALPPALPLVMPSALPLSAAPGTAPGTTPGNAPRRAIPLDQVHVVCQTSTLTRCESVADLHPDSGISPMLTTARTLL